jgi:iron complex outermembrane receptor protein
MRYVHDTRQMTYTPARFAVAASQANFAEPAPGTVTPAACPFTAIGLNQNPGGCLYRPNDIHFDYVPFTLGIDYRLPQGGLLYAKFSRGFRSGGFQQASGTTAAFFTPFGAESVSSYEVGTRLSFLDNHLRFSAAGYYSIYSDIQQTAVLSSSPVIINVLNAGKEEIYGGEFEASALIQRLRLTGSLGLIHAEFIRGPYTGSEVPTVAKTTYSISADYPIPVAGVGTLNLHADYNYRSRVFFLNTVRITATGPVPYTAFQIATVTQNGYGLLNGRIALELQSVPLTIAVYGRNLTNEYYAGRSGSFYGSNYNSIMVGEPRTYGVSATYRF